MMNRLAGEPSAYLRQHAHNPVAWQPFDDAAFAEAELRDVPIFLSVGYAACHWCHVMAGESFNDPAIGAYLNDHFVCIKVDREERPDVDDAYMAATQALSGQGGWPMSVFLTPAGLAFYAGTYFPPEPRQGGPSFRQVLQAVVEAWTERRHVVEESAASLSATLQQPLWQVRADTRTDVRQDRKSSPGPDESQTAWPRPGVELPEQTGPDPKVPLGAAVQAWLAAEDSSHGGFGGAPKFPPTPGLAFLLRHAAPAELSAAGAARSAEEARGLAGRTLGAMVHSALFDRLGGGFARYSVTADWSEPHYEKMLYDNAGLLQALVQWCRLDAGDSTAGPGPGLGGLAVLSAGEACDAAVVTVDWLLREMRLPGGAFASSLDADTVIDGVHYEGASYRWTVTELQDAVDGGPVDRAATKQLAAIMGVREPGSHPLHPGRALTAAEHQQWARVLPALLRARANRVMPARDDKVVAGWNGILLGALAEGAAVLGKPEWLAAAVELGDYVQQVHWDGEHGDGQLFRVSHEGRARGINGLLEDYAACAQGYLTLYAATGDTRWFEFARQLVAAAERDFIVDGVVLNHAASGGPVGAVAGSRFADPFDNATPSGVSLFAGALTSWAAYTGSAHHRALAASLLAGVPDVVRRAPRSVGGLLAVAQAQMAGPVEVAIVGPAGPARDALTRVAWHCASPGLVIAVWDGVGQSPVPLLMGRSLAERGPGRLDGGQDDGGDLAQVPLAYVCHNMSCSRPVSTAAELQTLLG